MEILYKPAMLKALQQQDTSTRIRLGVWLVGRTLICMCGNRKCHSKLFASNTVKCEAMASDNGFGGAKVGKGIMLADDTAL